MISQYWFKHSNGNCAGYWFANRRTGGRDVYAADGETLIAVHGEFCTGCLAVRGNCGSLTEAAVKQGRISDPRALENLEIARAWIAAEVQA